MGPSSATTTGPPAVAGGFRAGNALQVWGGVIGRTPIARFAAIGVVSTLAYTALFTVLRAWLGPAGANALALALTAIANTQANRRLTFEIRGRARLVRQHAMGAVVFLLTLGLTSGALAVLHALDHTPQRTTELGVLIASTLLATITRYVGLKAWVFARPGRSAPARGAPGRVAGP